MRASPEEVPDQSNEGSTWKDSWPSSALPGKDPDQLGLYLERFLSNEGSTWLGTLPIMAVSSLALTAWEGQCFKIFSLRMT